jgi:heme A synthase
VPDTDRLTVVRIPTMADSNIQTDKKFAYYAWSFLFYLLLVILFGAFVRISFSGAGCGDHWPTCHGEIIPPKPSTETMIEYTHRLTSGILGIFALVLVGWAWKKFGKHSRVFIASVVTLIFIIFEALIGAGIVLAELVNRDDSIARSVIISIHLVNTLMLTGSAGLVAWWGSGGSVPDLKSSSRLKWLIVVGMVGIILTSMSGAITALGDTLFPVDPTVGDGLFDRVRDDLSPTKHFLVRLRIIHPIVAVVTAGYLLVLSTIVRTSEVNARARTLGVILLVLTVVEVLAGVVNIWLHAPGWLQLTHLFLAQALWVALVLMGVESLATDEP